MFFQIGNSSCKLTVMSFLACELAANLSLLSFTQKCRFGLTFALFFVVSSYEVAAYVLSRVYNTLIYRSSRSDERYGY